MESSTQVRLKVLLLLSSTSPSPSMTIVLIGLSLSFFILWFIEEMTDFFPVLLESFRGEKFEEEATVRGGDCLLFLGLVIR